MRKFFAAIAIAALAAIPVFAGGWDKCDGDTQECLDYLANSMKNSGWVGVELDHGEHGMAITKVVDGSPAQQAGLQPGDVLVAVNGIDATNKDKIMEQKATFTPGQSVTWTVKRAGYNKDLKVTLGRMPADMLARVIGEHMIMHAATAEVAGN